MLTIYILCHNRPNDARNAIQSVIEQSDHDFTLVVSDNSSTDDVEQMVRGEYPEVNYIRRLPMLPSALHFKAIIDEAEDEYFCLFHDDDLMHRDFVSEMKRAISRFPEASAIACNAVVDNHGTASDWPSFRSYRQYETISSPAKLAMRYFSRGQSGIAPFPGYVYKRSKVSSSALDIEGGKYSDVTLLLNIAKSGLIVWISKTLMTYRIHGSNDGGTESVRDRLRFQRYLRRHARIFGHGIIQDYRCSFIYKPIMRSERYRNGKRGQLANKFLRTYNLLRYTRLDTYQSYLKRLMIKIMT